MCGIVQGTTLGDLVADIKYEANDPGPRGTARQRAGTPPEAGWQVDVGPAMTPADLAGVVSGYDALVVRGGTTITAQVLEAAGGRLRVIGRPGSGIDNIDVAAAARAGVRVVHSPMGNVVPTPELALALLLACARHVARADASMKAERWERKALTGVELCGRRLGIIGYGRVGRRL